MMGCCGKAGDWLMILDGIAAGVIYCNCSAFGFTATIMHRNPGMVPRLSNLGFRVLYA